jgi:hypothetical protein
MSDEVIKKAKNAVGITAGIWRDGEIIKMKLPHGKISYVSNDSTSKRYHPHLYKQLKDILIIEDRW